MPDNIQYKDLEKCPRCANANWHISLTKTFPVLYCANCQHKFCFEKIVIRSVKE